MGVRGLSQEVGSLWKKRAPLGETWWGAQEAPKEKGAAQRAQQSSTTDREHIRNGCVTGDPWRKGEAPLS